MFLDFSKAFDSIPHAEILYKLRLMVITGLLWCWFKDYLTNRRPFVEVDGVQTEMLPVRSGVAQGSILGPLLFIPYVNDIPSFGSFSSVCLYADYTKLIKSINSLEGCSHLQVLHSVLSAHAHFHYHPTSWEVKPLRECHSKMTWVYW